MSRFRVWLLGGLSLVSVAGYSHCPCDGPTGIERIQRGYLTVDDPSPFETELVSLGAHQAIANIAGGSGQNRLKVFWGDANDGLLTNPSSQTLCQGDCFNLGTVMHAPCFSFMHGSKASLSCFENSQWTTTEVPGDGYSHATFSVNSSDTWAATFRAPPGNYDFWKRSSGGSWSKEFTFPSSGVYQDANYGAVESVLCAGDDALWFAASQSMTDGFQYNLHKLDFNGSLQLTVPLHGVSSASFGLTRSKFVEMGTRLYGGFYYRAGPSDSAVQAWSLNMTDGTLDYAKPIAIFNELLATIPSLSILLQEDSRGTDSNIIFPTPDNRILQAHVSPNGSVSTSRLHGMLDQSSWFAVTNLSSTQYLVGGSFVIPGTDSQPQSVKSQQTAGATLTVGLITIGSYLNFAQFADGQGLSSELILTNSGSEEEPVALLLRDTNGADLSFDVSGGQITIPGTQYSGRYETTIPPSGVQSLRTDGDGDVVVGSARVEVSSAISGVIAFGGSFGLAGVGNSVALDDGFTAPMQTDQSRGLNTGVAVSNLSDSETTLNAELYSSPGVLVATAAPVDLAPGGQQAIYVDQFDWQTPVDFTNFRGLLKVSATGRTAATVLQTRPNQLASMPVRPL
jgi:hypothetical protein